MQYTTILEKINVEDKNKNPPPYIFVRNKPEAKVFFVGLIRFIQVRYVLLS